MQFKAYIFDFDGVIVDSGPLHERAWNQVAQERGQSITHEIFLGGFGVKNDLFIRDMLRWSSDPVEIDSIITRKEALFQSYLENEPIHLISGVKEFLFDLKKKKIPFALGSSSIRKNIDLVLEKVGLTEIFEIIISGEMVSHGKPDPEVFLKAATALRVNPSDCCVFEDAPLGVEAAIRAGMGVVALTTTFPSEIFSDRAIAFICNSFIEIKNFYEN